MPRSDAKLQTLVRLLSHREAVALRALADRQAAVAGASARAGDLSALQQEYQARLHDAGGGGARAGDLRLWRRFNESLDDVVEVQSAHLERLKVELERAQVACLAARAKRRGGERLEDTAQRRRESREQRREQRLASEAAARRQRG